MAGLLKFIDGYKTHITIFLGLVLFTLKFWDLIDPKTLEYLLKIDGGLFAFAVRDAMRKIENK